MGGQSYMVRILCTAHKKRERIAKISEFKLSLQMWSKTFKCTSISAILGVAAMNCKYCVSIFLALIQLQAAFYFAFSLSILSLEKREGWLAALYR